MQEESADNELRHDKVKGFSHLEAGIPFQKMLLCT